MEDHNATQIIYMDNKRDENVFIYLLSSSNVDVSFWSAGRDALDDLGEVLLDEVNVSRETCFVALVTYRVEDIKDVHPRIE